MDVMREVRDEEISLKPGPMMASTKMGEARTPGRRAKKCRSADYSSLVAKRGCNAAGLARDSPLMYPESYPKKIPPNDAKAHLRRGGGGSAPNPDRC